MMLLSGVFILIATFGWWISFVICGFAPAWGLGGLLLSTASIILGAGVMKRPQGRRFVLLIALMASLSLLVVTTSFPTL